MVGEKQLFFKQNIMNLEDIINELVEKIKELPDGTETSISRLLTDNNHTGLETKDLFFIDSEVRKRVELENVWLDTSGVKELMIGMPFSAFFIKRSK